MQVLHTTYVRNACTTYNVERNENSFMIKIYTAEDIGRFFGVSIQTINDWIHQGRILGSKDSDRIPDTAIYVSSTGQRLTMKEAAGLYDLETQRTTIQPLISEQELQEMLKDISFFEKKYGGRYDETLARKDNLTFEEERDSIEWKYLSKMTQR